VRLRCLFCFFANIFILISSYVSAAPFSNYLKVNALADFRWIHTPAETGWLDHGLGKTRYGGSAGERQNDFRVSQLSLLISTSFTPDVFARAQFNIDAEPDQGWKRHRFDLIEGYIGYHPVLRPYLRLRIRGGVFFPPVSLENRDAAWTSPYTITYSAINSWIGEEVRVTGGEGSLIFQKGGNEIAFSGSVFGKNDPTASLLAWRGWSFSDRQTGLSDQLPLASIPSLLPGGLFPQQPEYVQPFREVDGKPGFYGSFSWTTRRFEFNGLHYANRGVQTDFDGAQYAWDTTFGDLGLALHLPHNFEVIAQFLCGSSKMGFHSMVDMRYRATYALLSNSFGRNRLTLRYDIFRVDDRDLFVAADNNNESGHAWTAAYIFSFNEKYRVAAELLHVNSNRPERLQIGLPEREDATTFQTSLRLRF